MRLVFVWLVGCASDSAIHKVDDPTGDRDVAGEEPAPPAGPAAEVPTPETAPDVDTLPTPGDRVPDGWVPEPPVEYTPPEHGHDWEHGQDALPHGHAGEHGKGAIHGEADEEHGKAADPGEAEWTEAADTGAADTGAAIDEEDDGPGKSGAAPGHLKGR
jgi:hypothetical protein